ncbi:MAG TPA: hypothetical protein PKA55_11540 [Rhodoblastus sp.]|nr:hypothetical protein [Rhodoblastus sp.]
MSLAFEADFDPPDHRGQRLAIALGILAIGVMTVAAARATIVRLAPRTAILFEASGLPVNLTGLALDRITAKIVADGDRRILVVEGDLVNNGARDEVARPLAVSVRGEGDEALYTWVTRAPQQKIAAGDRAAFVARLASPPAKGTSVAVEFDRAAPEPSAASPADTRKPSRR